jgi:hypothetical protein
MGFAVAVQAGDAKTSQAKDQDQPSCCSSKMKTSLTTSTETKEGTCPMASGSCCKQKAAKQTAKTAAIKSPKDASKG